MEQAWPEWALRMLATWRDAPERQQWLLVGTALFAALAGILYFTRLGNRRLALKCLLVASVLHALAWGYAREYHELTIGKKAASEKVPTPDRFSVLLPPPVSESNTDETREELRTAERGELPEPDPEALARRQQNPPTPEPIHPQEPEPVSETPLPNAETRDHETNPDGEPLAPEAKPGLAAFPTLPEPTEAPEERPLESAPVEGPVVVADEMGPVVARRRPAQRTRPAARPAPVHSQAEAEDIVPTTRPPRHSEEAEPEVPLPTPGTEPSGPLASAVDPPNVPTPVAERSGPAEPRARDVPEEFDEEPPLLARRAKRTRESGPGPRPRAPATEEAEIARPAGPADLERDLPPGAANEEAIGGLGAVTAIWRNRTAPDRREIVERFGGSARTEQAVASALEWLALHQSAEGYWDSDGFFDRCPAGDRCEGPAIEGGSDAGLTGLALLAFLGAGHTHRESEQYREVVRKGLSWLLSMQRPDGDLRYRGRIYCHSMATLSLTEAFAMSGDGRLKEPAQRAIDWLAAAQHPQSGGWRYGPGQFGDTSVYGWAILALRSAQNSGLEVPEATWDRSRQWLNLVSLGARGGLACYRPGSPPTHAMTAEALVCRQVFGLARGDPRMDEAGDYLLARPPDPSDYHLYYWYYGTLAMFQLGGDHWLRWNDRLARTLLATQNMTGHRRGSWDPQRPFGVDGGRVFATACSALCLEVYYRYLPLYTQSGLGSAEPGPRKRPGAATP